MKSEYEKLESLITSLSGQMGTRFDKLESRFDTVENDIKDLKLGQTMMQKDINQVKDQVRIIATHTGVELRSV